MKLYTTLILLLISTTINAQFEETQEAYTSFIDTYCESIRNNDTQLLRSLYLNNKEVAYIKTKKNFDNNKYRNDLEKRFKELIADLHKKGINISSIQPRLMLKDRGNDISLILKSDSEYLNIGFEFNRINRRLSLSSAGYLQVIGDHNQYQEFLKRYFRDLEYACTKKSGEKRIDCGVIYY